ncbi:MAG: dethiobiotin synthase [Arsenophonus sp. ET-YP4-MAG3]
MFFLTGTDTGIGKTVVTCALLQAAADYGYQTAGYKPIASGGKKLKNGLINSDAQLLKKNSSLKLNYHDVNPIVFFQETSPHIASQITGEVINLEIINVGLNKLKQSANWLIIEGIGGWYTPLSAKRTLSDWVIQQKLPVILTVGIKLGCINHSILTAQAIQQSGLLLVGWVANEIILPDQYQQDYLLSLQEWLSVPCLGIIPHLPNWQSYSIGKFINLNSIL